MVDAAPKPRALVMLDPRGAFTSVRARPMWLASLLVVLAFALAPPLVFLSRVDETVYAERKLRRSGNLDKVAPEQRAQVIEITAKAVRVGGPPGALAKRATWILVVAALAFALVRGKRPELKFPVVLGAVIVGAAPLAIKDLFEAGAFLIQDPLELDEQNAVLSNPAAWLSIDSQARAVGALLRGLDFFELWSCALMAIGVNVVAGTRSWLPHVVAFGLHGVVVAVATVGVLMS